MSKKLINKAERGTKRKQRDRKQILSTHTAMQTHPHTPDG